jgi:hypothetical protein
MTPAQIMTALAPAALLAAVIMLIAWRPWRRDVSAQGAKSAIMGGGYWAGPLACALGFLCSAVTLNNGWPGHPPRERWQWLFYMAIVALIIGVVAALWQPRGWIRLAIGAALGGSVGFLLHVPPSFAEHQTSWRYVLGGGTFLTWLSLDTISLRRPGASIPLALWVVFTGLSVILLESRWALLALMDASVAATLGAIVLTAWLNPRVTLAHGAGHVLATLLSAILVLGWLYNRGDVPAVCYGLMAASPLMLWLAELRFITNLKAWQAAAIRFGTVSAPVAMAIGMAALRGEAAESM